MIKAIKQKLSKIFQPNKIVDIESYEIKDRNGNVTFSVGKMYFNSGRTHAFANKRVFNSKNEEIDRIHVYLDPKANIKEVYERELQKCS